MRLAWGGLLAATFALSSGCMSYFHSIDPPHVELLDACKATPKCARDHVYIFFVDGLDPFNFANLSGVCEYVQSLGFHKTHWGQLFHAPMYAKELRTIRESDPEAHFVLVGFSYGANAVRTIANAAKADDIFIDLIVYLGGNTLQDIPNDQPENAGHIINILATGWIWNGADMERAENISVPDVWHFGSPSHPQTLNLLAENLAALAEAIPVPEAAPPAQMRPAGEEEPTPRPVMNRTSNKSPGWDFLHPCSRLRMPPPLDMPDQPKTPPPVAPDRIALR